MDSMLFKPHHTSRPHSPEVVDHRAARPLARQKRNADGKPRRYRFGLRIEKSKYHMVQDAIRKIGGIGWAVLVPTALGAVLGLWMDTLWPSAYSWFHILFPIGAFIGCLTAILWGSQDPDDQDGPADGH